MCAFVVTGSVARSGSLPVFNLLKRPILRFFAPQGRHFAPMEVKFRMDEGTEGPLLHAKFHPHRCNDKCVEPPKLKFCTSFFRMR